MLNGSAIAPPKPSKTLVLQAQLVLCPVLTDALWPLGLHLRCNLSAKLMRSLCGFARIPVYGTCPITFDACP